MPVSSADILSFLSILVAIMIVVVLYHLLFIVVDLRRILRRFDDLTAQVETVILKPLSIADQLFQWVKDKVEHHADKHHSEKKD